MGFLGIAFLLSNTAGQYNSPPFSPFPQKSFHKLNFFSLCCTEREGCDDDDEYSLALSLSFFFCHLHRPESPSLSLSLSLSLSVFFACCSRFPRTWGGKRKVSFLCHHPGSDFRPKIPLLEAEGQRGKQCHRKVLILSPIRAHASARRFHLQFTSGSTP